MSSLKNSPPPTWVYSRLVARFGPQGWWPLACKYHPGKFPKLTPDQAFEIAVGAILTQNTAWTNVNKALTELRRMELLRPDKILSMPSARLAKLIRSSGYFIQKAKKLKIFSQFVLKEARGNLMNLDSGLRRNDGKQEGIRQKLLALWGVGPETADSILLYALDQPVFVVDAYTRRIGERLGWGRWMKPSVRYDAIRAFLETRLNPVSRLYQEYHALLVELAKRHCTKNNPLCAACPLKSQCAYFLRSS